MNNIESNKNKSKIMILNKFTSKNKVKKNQKTRNLVYLIIIHLWLINKFNQGKDLLMTQNL